MNSPEFYSFVKECAEGLVPAEEALLKEAGQNTARSQFRIHGPDSASGHRIRKPETSKPGQ
jgi:hypothetical protein